MAIEFNLQGDCDNDTLGTGLDACVALYGDLNGIDLFPAGTFSLDTSIDSLPTETEYKELIQDKKIYPLNDLYDFDQTTPDNEIASSSRGIKKEVRTGKPEFSLMWSNSACFHQSVFDKRGTGRWDISMKFETGILFTRNIGSNKLKPFNNGLFSVGTYKFQQGGDPDLTTVFIQFPTPDEFNKRQVFFTWDELGYDMGDTNGVLNAKLKFTIVPTASTDFSISIKSLCNESVVITGLELPNDYLLGGIQTSPTTITSATFNVATQAYDFVVAPALILTDTVQISLADISGGFNVAENVSGDLFQGSTPLVTV